MAYVTQPYVGTSQKTRNRKISGELEAVLSAVAAETGVTFKVTSGGQFAKGKGPRVKGSSVRHDDGGAADVEAYDANGNAINFTTPEGRATWAQIVSLARASGATGIGAGVDYMGPTTVHIGFGKPAVWSSKTSGQPVEDWLRTAYDRGGKIPPLNIPDVASLTDTQRTPPTPMPLPSFMRPAASSTESLSKTLGARLPDAAMYGVRPGGKRATADDLTMTPGHEYELVERPSGVVFDDRLMGSLMRSQDAVRADPIGAGPASWFPKAAQPAATSTAQIKTDPLGAGAESWGDFTRAMGVPLAAPAPLTPGASPTPLPSGVMRAVTPGVQQAGTVAMPPGARPASVPLPTPLPALGGVAGMGGMAGAAAGAVASPTAPTPLPGRPAALSSAPTPLPSTPQRPQMPAPSAQVRELQQQLTARGYSPGAADGIFGNRTDAAVRAFQQANGLAVDGIVGPRTMAALQGTRTPPQPFPAPAAKPAPMPIGTTGGNFLTGFMDNVSSNVNSAVNAIGSMKDQAVQATVQAMPSLQDAIKAEAVKAALGTVAGRTAFIDPMLARGMTGTQKPTPLPGQPAGTGSKGYSNNSARSSMAWAF